MRLILFIFLASTMIACVDSPKNNSAETLDLTKSDEEQIQQGRVLFSANCKLCHSLDVSQPTGLAPVLDSVSHHWQDDDLAKYIKNAPAMMQSTEHSRKVYRDWKDKPQMPPFAGLSEAEIKNIIAYLKSET